MHPTKGLVCAVLTIFMIQLSCGADEVNERRRTPNRTSADSTEKDGSKTEQTDKKTDKKTDKPVEPAAPAIQESTLPWDGVELVAPDNMMILEME